MTTLVLSRKERAMVADRQATNSVTGHKTQMGKKIQRLFHPDTGEILLGCAGENDACTKFEMYFRKTLETPGIVVSEKDVRKMTAIAFYSSGKIYVYEGSLTPFELDDKVYGIGSGAPYAIGALLHGANLKEAIRIASVCDAYTGFGIQYEAFRH